ncbi:hypothetical protein HYW83_03050 [Candidatus Peregrinibacteria bacterium]|nr:hypothetical protein [Candidatus Peregrinibacteria bacterium]
MDANVSTYIDRKTASQLLSVSIRTIDRYIRSGKLWAISENGRIWLDKKEILSFSSAETTSRKMTIDRPMSLHVRSAKESSTDFYQDLYGEAKRALSDYQQKLEQANYRIGQLESQILNPLASKTIERRDESLSTEFMRKELHEREKEINAFKELLKKERTGRIIFAALTYVLLILLPTLWYLLR